MTPDLPRCPSCAAAVRQDAPWCTQCYADLRTRATEPVPAALVPAPRAPEPALGRWPCTACAGTNPLDRDVCATCGEAFLAEVTREEPPLLVLPVVGDLTRLSRTQRMLFGVAASSAAVLATGLLGLLLR